MQAKDVILRTWEANDRIIGMYVEDLQDHELLIRAVDGMNHIAWQLGHLILGERRMIESIRPGVSPALPEGFEEAYDKESATSDDSGRFLSKAEYRRLAAAQRQASKEVLASLSDADLDAPGSEFLRTYAPTVGAVLLMVGTHGLLHCGQFVGVRRKVGKPVLF